MGMAWYVGCETGSDLGRRAAAAVADSTFTSDILVFEEEGASTGVSGSWFSCSCLISTAE